MMTTIGRALAAVSMVVGIAACAVSRAPIVPPRLPRLEPAPIVAISVSSSESAVAQVEARDSSGDYGYAGPLSLRQLQEEARARSPSVEQWEARVRALRNRVRQARASYFPRLATESRFVRRDEELSFRDPGGNDIVFVDRDLFTQRTTLAYNVLDWGRAHFAHRGAQQEWLSVRARKDRADQDLDLEVARVYYSILGLDQERLALAASVESLEGSAKLARDLRSVGRATQADVLIVEARVAQRRFDLRSLDDLIVSETEELARLLDQPPGARIELAAPDDVSVERALRLPWEALALTHRPELRAFDSEHRAILDARRSELATFLPSVDLFAQHEYSSTESDFGDPSFFSGGVNATWEVFAGGRRRFRASELQANADAVRAEQRAFQRRVVADVRRIERALVRSQDRIEVAAVVVAQAEEHLGRVRDLFREGRANGQEVLEAESLLDTERSIRIRARFELLLTYARLLHACGVGGEDGAIEEFESEELGDAPLDGDPSDPKSSPEPESEVEGEPEGESHRDPAEDR